MVRRREKEVGERELTKPPTTTARIYIHFDVFAGMAISEVDARFWNDMERKGGKIPRDVRYPHSPIQIEVAFYGFSVKETST